MQTPWSRLRTERAEEKERRAARGHQTASEFADACVGQASGRARLVAVTLRAIVAQSCDLPEEFIWVDDYMNDLVGLMGTDTFLGWLLDPSPGAYDGHSVHYQLEFRLSSLFGKRINIRTLDADHIYELILPRSQARSLIMVKDWVSRIVNSFEMSQHCHGG